MAETTDRILIRKNIRLYQHHHLIFDKERETYRASYWRPRKPGEEGNDVPPHIHEGMTKAAMVPKQPRNYWVRFASASTSLRFAIENVMQRGGSDKQIDELFNYIRSTEWGAHLELDA